MQFEYQFNFYNDEIPDLVIPVTEILKARNFETDEKAFHEKALFSKCLAIYSEYCGCRVGIFDQHFAEFCNEIGKKGKVIFSYHESENGVTYHVRVVSDEGEKILHPRLSYVARGRIIREIW